MLLVVAGHSIQLARSIILVYQYNHYETRVYFIRHRTALRFAFAGMFAIHRFIFRGAGQR